MATCLPCITPSATGCMRHAWTVACQLKDVFALQVMYIAHCGDSGAVMACTSYDLHFPLRLTTDHKPNRADEHARIQAANGNVDEQHNRVVSEPKPHNGRVTLLSMSR